jgi:diguanylate cyclase (GGDEF)-like protein
MKGMRASTHGAYPAKMNQEKKAAIIQATELFSPLSLSQVLPIAERSTERFFPQGSIILKENEQGSTLHIVTEGVVRIFKGTVSLGEARRGEFFGELALIGEGTRTASAMASTDVSTLCIDQKDFVSATTGNWDVNRKIFKALSRIIRSQSDLYIQKTLEQEETNRKMQYAIQLNKFMEVGKAITSVLNVKDILSTLLDRVGHIIQAKGIVVFLLDHQQNNLFVGDFKGFDAPLPSGLRISLSTPFAKTVCEALSPIVIEDIHAAAWGSILPQTLLGLIDLSALFVPLRIQKEVMGLVGMIDVKDIHPFREEHRPYLDILADYVSIALANATNYETIKRLSVTDDVTGFYNTRFLHQYLDEVLAEATVRGEPVSLVFFDLDHFKLTVDTHGHLLGSQVLKEVAQFVSGFLGETDRIVRYGGDEYILILPRQGREEALAKVQLIKEGLNRTSFLQKENICENVRASFGIATFPDDASDKASLLKEADHYMYSSKRSGKNLITSGSSKRTPAIHP